MHHGARSITWFRGELVLTLFVDDGSATWILNGRVRPVRCGRA